MRYLYYRGDKMISKLKLNKKWILIAGIFFLLFTFFLFSKQEDSVPTENLLEPVEEVKKPKTTLAVDIKGAVKNPGVYQLEENTRILDVIEKSGGFLENADTTTINLSKKLEDEMVIIIYTKEEIASFKETEQRVNKTDTTCICPKIENQACIKEAVTNYQSSNQPKSENFNKTVSLNNGSATDFETLPGIGSSKANAIVSYREEHGNFSSIEEIKNVSGIGDATFEKIKAYLTL